MFVLFPWFLPPRGTRIVVINSPIVLLLNLCGSAMGGFVDPAVSAEASLFNRRTLCGTFLCTLGASFCIKSCIKLCLNVSLSSLAVFWV